MLINRHKPYRLFSRFIGMTVATTFGKATPIGYFSIDITLFAPKNVQVGIVRLPECEKI